MKRDDLLDAIGMIDEKYIEEAEKYSKSDTAPEKTEGKNAVFMDEKEGFENVDAGTGKEKQEEKSFDASMRNRRKKKIWISLASAACLCLLVGSAWAIRGGWGITGMDGAKDMAAVSNTEAAQGESDAASNAEAAQDKSDTASNTGTTQGEADADKPLNVTNRQEQDEEISEEQKTKEDEEIFKGQEAKEDETISEKQESEKAPGFWERIRTFFERLFHGRT